MIRSLAVALAMLLLAACRSQAPNPAPTPTALPTPPGPAQAAGARPSPSPSAILAAAPTVPSPSPAACGYEPFRRLTEVQDRRIVEASGLTASRRWSGVYWTLNDSGNQPELFAFDLTGRALGTYRVLGATNFDWESLHAGPGRDGGWALYIGDTGDNRGTRPEVVIYRTPEPEVDLAAQRPVAQTTAPVEAFRFQFPDLRRDVEAMLVHPTSGETLLLSKTLSGRSAVYRVPQPLEAGSRRPLEPVGELDLSWLTPLGGIVTDAAVSADGRKAVIRTYTVALEYQVPEGASLASITSQRPVVYRLDDGQQGEGITYRLDRPALLAIGEGAPVLYQAEWRC